MKYKEPIDCLKNELKSWRIAKKTFENAIYSHSVYDKAIANCDRMIKVYSESIAKLKSK